MAAQARPAMSYISLVLDVVITSLMIYARKEVPYFSAGTNEDVDLEVLVDDFVMFYMAGEQIMPMQFGVS